MVTSSMHLLTDLFPLDLLLVEAKKKRNGFFVVNKLNLTQATARLRSTHGARFVDAVWG